jgi:hypothetical protein
LTRSVGHLADFEGLTGLGAQHHAAAAAEADRSLPFNAVDCGRFALVSDDLAVERKVRLGVRLRHVRNRVGVRLYVWIRRSVSRVPSVSVRGGVNYGVGYRRVRLTVVDLRIAPRVIIRPYRGGACGKNEG